MSRTPEYDVVIVGGGPAGTSLSIRLAFTGLRVLLAEAKRFPRSKLCGEFISPECFSHFKELGVLPELETAGGTQIFRTVFYSRDGSSVDVPSEWFGMSGPALGLSRAVMDERLLTRASHAGVDVRQHEKAAELLFDGQRVTGVRLKDEGGGYGYDLPATLTIDATGRSRSLLRQLAPKQRTRASFVAFKTHLQGADIGSGECEIYSYRGGYGGCLAVEDGLQNLCFIVSTQAAKDCSTDLATIMKNVVFRNRRAAAALTTARITGDAHAVPIESYGRRDPAPAEGLLAVGDAAAFIDPFTGSGILMALECSQLAAQLITAELRKAGSQPDFRSLARRYDHAHARRFASRFRTGRILRIAAFAPSIASFTVASLSASKRLTRVIAQATRAS